MSGIVEVDGLAKRYDGGFEALKGVDLSIREGEILALLGPNGAGKTTLISTICGITVPTDGAVRVGGHDVVRDFRAARRMIGLVPQEINLEPFEKVRDTVAFSRGLFGAPRDDAKVAAVLEALSLTDKAGSQIKELSGGMKRRVLIAKALSHDPKVLFLDEPTAGVDVELRRGMWEVVAELKRRGVTIILTTHYIEEAEAIADRIAVISKGRILLVEEKDALMARMGRKEMVLELSEPLDALPPALRASGLALGADGSSLRYVYDVHAERTGITRLLSDLQAAGIRVRDVTTRQSSLEEIFTGLVDHDAREAAE
ncbi:ABC-2 type transport system ATP-binding protein [Hasllibacter halocynthiae]|uniref:ABC-2 type transport system ATP-binding protein n=1 Tax=Hasllibacter halocynthiae TaxID=595589 RepID=A0A2T0X3R2_9RHOB|nr:ABC transporter ATP-binding protein [Hasllibacter halocynthiae]PRY93582.1 ABC-2 type transport system ATP-binding protein [Hasllibacter halocynthiae]